MGRLALEFDRMCPIPVWSSRGQPARRANASPSAGLGSERPSATRCRLHLPITNR